MKQRYAEFVVLLTSDKRKAAVLTVLLLVAGVLFLKMMLAEKPSSAVASTTSESVPASQARGEDSSLVAVSKIERPPLVMLPSREPLTRDLFAPGPDFRPQPLQSDQPEASGPKSAERSDDNSPVSPELRRLELERVVREEASRLHLRSTMIGANPVAVIQHDGANGARSVLRVGDVILGFELVEVSARSVVLSKSGIRVEMNIGAR